MYLERESKYERKREVNREGHVKKRENPINRIGFRKRKLRLSMEEGESVEKKEIEKEDTLKEEYLGESEIAGDAGNELQENNESNNTTNDDGNIVKNNNSGGDNKRKRRDRRGGVKIRLLNAQALTETKQLTIIKEFFENSQEYNIVCLTETKQRTNKIAVPDSLYSYTAMREGKKATHRGGLQILGLRDKRVEWKKINTGENKDLLVIEGKCFGVKMRIILVYFDSNKKKDSEQARENKSLRDQVEKAIRENKMEGLMVLGDMNAHLRLLEEDKRDDINGKMIMDWMEEEDLYLLNGNEKCTGKYTWG